MPPLPNILPNPHFIATKAELPTRISSSSSSSSVCPLSSGRSQPSRARGWSLAGSFLESFLCWKGDVYSLGSKPTYPFRSRYSQTQTLCAGKRLEAQSGGVTAAGHTAGTKRQDWKPIPSQNVGRGGQRAHLDFLMFGAQEAGACHGQVHPEHTEEQQAADGPRREHGLGWGQMALGREGLCTLCYPLMSLRSLWKELSRQWEGT
jgi:hypothetical protein